MDAPPGVTSFAESSTEGGANESVLTGGGERDDLATALGLVLGDRDSLDLW